jgi:DNA-binding IclR family transcriptional regulator
VVRGSETAEIDLGPSPSSKSVLGKAFRILDCFLGGDVTLTLTELANRSGLPKSTVHRLAGALVEWGALERVYGEFRLGLRLFELGGLVPRWRIIREAALPFMEDLFLSTRETVHLGILEGGNVLYLEKIRGHRSAPTLSRIGGRLPAYCTGIGKALLAFAPLLRDEVLAGPLPRLTPYTISAPSALREELQMVVEQGFAVDREEAILGFRCVAAAALSSRNESVAALSVTCSSSDFEPDRLAPAVRSAALGLSRAMPAFV